MYGGFPRSSLRPLITGQESRIHSVKSFSSMWTPCPLSPRSSNGKSPCTRSARSPSVMGLISIDHTLAFGHAATAAEVKMPTPAPTSATTSGAGWFFTHRLIIQVTSAGGVKNVPSVRRDLRVTTPL